MSAELTALELAKILATKAARLWLSAKEKEQARNLDLSELVRIKVPGLFAQRSIERQFEQLTDSVALRLDAILSHEFSGLSSGDKRAALAAVVQALSSVDLSDNAIMAADANAENLYRKIISDWPADPLLGESGKQLYELAVRESCICYVKIVRNLPPFTERAVSELLRRTTDILAEVSRILEQLPKPTLLSPQATHADDEFERMYAQLVSTELDEVELFSVMPGATLRSKLSVAYISLSASTPGATAYGPKYQLAQYWQDYRLKHRASNQSVPVETALGRGKRTLIRGEAGSGKTTLLRWLAVTAARRGFVTDLQDWNGLVPFFIKLRNYTTGTFPQPKQYVSSVAHVLSGVMPAGWVERILSEGRGLVLIDGIDELADSDREPAQAWIRQLIRAYPSNRVIVTSRPAVVTANWLTRISFSSVMMEPMSPSDQRTFVRHWHNAVKENVIASDVEELPRYESALVAALSDRSELRAIAETPLLAAMLCALNLHKRQQLPRNRMELYRMAVELLLQRDASRDVPSSKVISLNLNDKMFILSDLAWRLSDNNLTELDVERAVRYVAQRTGKMPSVTAEPVEVLSHLLARSGLLREPSKGRIDFIHRTFQEYFASMEAASEDRIGNLVGRASLPQWRETIVMAAGHCTRKQTTELITGIYDRIKFHESNKHLLWLLIAACIETMTSVPEDLTEIIDECLAELTPPSSIIDALALAQAGPLVLKRLPSSLAGMSEPEAEATIRMTALIGGPSALGFLEKVSYSAAGYSSISALLGAWDYFDPNEYATRVLARVAFRHHAVRVNDTLQLAVLNTLEGADGVEISDRLKFSLDYVEQLKRVKRLRRLRIRDFAALNDLSVFEQLPDLEVLQISRGGIYDGQAFPDLPRLVSLALNAWKTLPNFSGQIFPSRLEQISLSLTRNGFDCECLAQCKGLRSLVLEVVGQPINLETLSATKLAYMELLGPIAYDETLGAPRKLSDPQLTQRCLELPSLEAFRALRGLKRLSLRGLAAGTDLAPITDLPLLRELDLRDADGALDLSPLSSMRRSLKVSVTKGQPLVGIRNIGDMVKFC